MWQGIQKLKCSVNTSVFYNTDVFWKHLIFLCIVTLGAIKLPIYMRTKHEEPNHFSSTDWNKICAVNDWWLTILALYCNRKLNISKLLQNVGKLSMCGGTFHIKMFLIHSPWCHHSFTSHFFSQYKKMVGLFIPCPHGDWKLACTMCDTALRNWSVFKTLQCFKILNCFQNTSVFEYLVTLSARKWLLFCGFLKLSSPLNALSHMVQAY